jgi:hypothetical protein
MSDVSVQAVSFIITLIAAAGRDWSACVGSRRKMDRWIAA